MKAKKVIVCDDQAVFRELTASFLHLKGWEVLRAQSGEECVKLAQSGDVESILLDINLPGMDGYETARQLKKINSSANIVLMTGFRSPATQGKADEIDASALMLKPFDLRALHDVLVNNMGDKVETSKNKRVLVVDDEDLLRDMLSMFLNKNGFEVVTARDGAEGLERAQQENFFAIFMDIRMPRLDGLGALTRMRELKIKTPVFLMSGFSEELTSVDQAKKKGATSFLAKPFKPARAIELLRSNLVGIC